MGGGGYYGGAAIATSINVGAKISLSGDGEISAPKKKPDKNEYNIFNHL